MPSRRNHASVCTCRTRTAAQPDCAFIGEVDGTEGGECECECECEFGMLYIVSATSITAFVIGHAINT